MDAFKGRHVPQFLHIPQAFLNYQGGNIMGCVLLFRSQTTKGIWMAKCTGIEPCTLVMDLEGTDGRERGEVLFICCTFTYFSHRDHDAESIAYCLSVAFI